MNQNKSLNDTSGISKNINTIFRGENRELATSMITLVNEFEDYWETMTLRSFYYQAVAALLIENNINQYQALSRLMAKLRRHNLIPWDAINDKTRTTSNIRGLFDVNIYIETDMRQFLSPEYYQRCYTQGQPVYVELSIEKDALEGHIRAAAWEYSSHVSVTKGQMSATMLNDMAKRFERNIKQGKEPILLHFGDLDPTGIQIPKSIKEGLWSHHKIEVDVRQIGLTPEQCITHQLPQSLDAAKEKDPNLDRWYTEYGNQSPTELDALHPEKLKQLVTTSLDEIYDIDLMDEQRIKETEEQKLLGNMRGEAIKFLHTKYPEYMSNIPN